MTTTSQSYSPLETFAAVASCFSSFLGFSSPAESRTRIGEPCATLSPTFTLIDCTVPAPGDGISIVALSDSRVMSDCSLATLSPGLTRTSMTSTLLKSPMSGTFTSWAAMEVVLLEDQLADIGEHGDQVRAEARGGRAGDGAVIVGERERQHQAGLEDVLAPIAFSGINRFQGTP